MKVGVAVHALLERQLLFEIAPGMALRAFNRGMFAKQGIFRLRMVKVLAEQGDIFPTGRGVAGAAVLRKGAAVGVPVAVCALLKGDSSIAGPIVGPGSVALVARYLCVQAGKGIPGFGMVEFADVDRLPVVVVMAL